VTLWLPSVEMALDIVQRQRPKAPIMLMLSTPVEIPTLIGLIAQIER
jgi:hypothetical protein